MENSSDSVHFLGDTFPQLIYGGSVVSISAKQLDGLQLNQKTGELEPMYHGRYVTLKDYDVTYQYPTYSLPKLKAVTSGEKDPESIKTQYLQLPENLPERVKKLTESITKDAQNRYDKAIENKIMTQTTPNVVR